MISTFQSSSTCWVVLYRQLLSTANSKCIFEQNLLSTTNPISERAPGAIWGGENDSARQPHTQVGTLSSKKWHEDRVWQPESKFDNLNQSLTTWNKVWQPESNSVLASCRSWRSTSTLRPAPPFSIPPCKSKDTDVTGCQRETSQILELVGHPLPDVGGTQPHHHCRPRHQHRYLRSIGEQFQGILKMIVNFHDRCGIVQMPQSDRLGQLHWLQPLDFFSIRAWMQLMESKRAELGPAVPWGSSLTTVVTPFQQVLLLHTFFSFTSPRPQFSSLLQAAAPSEWGNIQLGFSSSV